MPDGAPPPDDPEAQRREILDRKAANRRKYRALLKQGGKVLTLQIKDKNKFISALLNTRWLELSESEDWAVVADRTAVMLNEFAATYGDEPTSPMDRQAVKRLPSSKS